ncbi:MAG: hypothetical protein ACRC8Y_16635 [Chroococcales cyanobacterium]
MTWPTCLHSITKKQETKPDETTVQWAEIVLELYAAGWTQQQVFGQYPHLTPDLVTRVFSLAALLCVKEEVLSQLSGVPESRLLNV